MKPTERQFMHAVIDLAKLCGYRVYHPPDNKPNQNGRVQNTEPGYPDLTMARPATGKYYQHPPRLIFAELKTDTGRISRAQSDWLSDLDAVAEAYVWRPDDLLTGKIARTLRR